MKTELIDNYDEVFKDQINQSRICDIKKHKIETGLTKPIYSKIGINRYTTKQS